MQPIQKNDITYLNGILPFLLLFSIMGLTTKWFTPTNILLIISVILISLAILLAAASLSKSVKWNLYDSETDYGSGSNKYKIFAYQNLWTYYDIWNGTTDKENAQAYNIINDDSWRRLPRTLVILSVVIGAASLAIILPFSLIPLINKRARLLNIARIGCSMLSITAGCMLAYALNYYWNRYPLLLCPTFYDPTSYYPDEDNVSAGFYLTSFSSAFLFISAVLNIACVFIFIKDKKTEVVPLYESTTSCTDVQKQSICFIKIICVYTACQEAFK